MGNISLVFTAHLQARRAIFNERFVHAKRMYPELDSVAFTDFLVKIVDPLILAAEHLDPAALASFIDYAYNVGIEMTGKKIIGPQARCTAVEKLWRTVFPALMPVIVNNPGSMLVKLSNAAYQLDIEVQSRFDEWLALFASHASHCNDCDTLLAFAQVCAWKCGMAHYRNSAIPLLKNLPAPLCRALFDETDNCNWTDEVERMLADPWYTPAQEAKKHRKPTMYCTGGFRGLGGPFLHPPIATLHKGQLLLWCNDEWWIIHADLFGVTCKRLIANHSAQILRPGELDGKTSSGSNGCVIEGGKVIVKGITYDLSSEGTVSGAAFVSNTLLVSLENSHQVWIFEEIRS